MSDIHYYYQGLTIFLWGGGVVETSFVRKPLGCSSTVSIILLLYLGGPFCDGDE